MKAILDFKSSSDLSVAIGSDHGGFECKNAVVNYLKDKGISVYDTGPADYDAADDYPDFAEKVAKYVSLNEANACGILICTSGIGMSINANRFHNVRAALITDTDAARTSRTHNCSNILVAGGCDTETLTGIIDAFLEQPFSFEERHVRRLEKIERNSYANTSAIYDVDPEVAKWIEAEHERQDDIIELIASENVVSPAILAAQGSVLTNKYAEGYPGRRYYGGCEKVDVIEQLAIDRAKELFGAEAANVQAHSGSQANMAAYFAILEPGDTILGFSLAHGGHLTHGFHLNFSGKMYNIVGYEVDAETETLDYDELERLAVENKPQLLLAGASAYPRFIDFPRLREIADKVGAYFMVDMAHIAGLVAAGVHPSPIPHADIVTTTTHKTLRGPRSGLILCKEELIKKINSRIFPGIQGGPLMHVIAAKAICFREAMTDDFKEYGAQVVKNATVLADALENHGFRIVSGGTDNHLMLVDLRPLGATGKQAQEALDNAGITTNKNLIPFDPEKAMVTSGIRIGTPTVTSRGMKEAEMLKIANWIHKVISNLDDEELIASVKEEVLELTAQFPIP